MDLFLDSLFCSKDLYVPFYMNIVLSTWVIAAL